MVNGNTHINRLLQIFFATSVLFFVLNTCIFFVKSSQSYILRQDFIVYLSAAKIVSGENRKLLYSPEEQFRVQREILNKKNPSILFVYPPISAQIFYPLTLFDLVTSYRIMLLINVAMLIVAGILLVKYFGENKKVFTKYLFLLPFVILPSTTVIDNGQISALILLIYLSILFSLNKKDFQSGLFTGLLLLKPHHLLIAPFVFLISKNKKSFIAGSALTILALLLLSVRAVGVQALMNYPRFMFATNVNGFGVINHHLHSFYPILERLVGFLGINSKVSYVLNFSAYVFMVIIFGKYVNKRPKAEYARQFSITVLISIFFMIRVYTQTLTLLLIPIAFLLSRRNENYNFVVALTLLIIPWIGQFKYPYLLSIFFIYTAFYMMGYLPRLSRR